MHSLRSLQQLLDSAFRVPGTNIQFGWDPIIGLLPWIGDILAAIFSCAIILQAHHMQVPRVVQLRMVMNVLIDVVLGVIPVFGDVADLLVFQWHGEMLFNPASGFIYCPAFGFQPVNYTRFCGQAKCQERLRERWSGGVVEKCKTPILHHSNTPPLHLNRLVPPEIGHC